jgi:hypothetical protein
MADPICPTRRLDGETHRGLPRPKPMQGSSNIDPEDGFVLPRPIGRPSNITDTGRIKFGAGFRLRSIP